MWNWSDQTGIKAEEYDLNKSGANVWISNTFQTMCTAGSSGQQQSGLVNRSLKQWPYIWTFFVKSIIIINCRQKTLHWYWYWGWGSLGGSRWRSGTWQFYGEGELLLQLLPCQHRGRGRHPYLNSSGKSFRSYLTHSINSVISEF